MWTHSDPPKKRHTQSCTAAHLPEHDDNLRVGERPCLHVQLEGLPVQLPRLRRLAALRLCVISSRSNQDQSKPRIVHRKRQNSATPCPCHDGSLQPPTPNEQIDNSTDRLGHHGLGHARVAVLRRAVHRAKLVRRLFFVVVVWGSMNPTTSSSPCRLSMRMYVCLCI